MQATLACGAPRATLTRMTKIVTLRDVNQQFARYLREVEAGEEFVITRNGKPVARLTPVARRRVLTPRQRAAWERIEARMREGWPLGAGKLDRDALHDREAMRREFLRKDAD